MLAAAGQEFEDCRLSQEEWGKLKATAHFAQLPYLSIKCDGNEIFFNQSMAIGEFCLLLKYLVKLTIVYKKKLY